MSSPYPPSFETWPLEKRNAYFAAEARRLRGKEKPQRTAQTKSNGGDSQPPYVPLGEPVAPKTFKVERWEEIAFKLDEEWRADGLMPKRGVGLIFGASQSFKSFLAMSVGLNIALGRSWAGRETEPADVIYIAAEGAGGLRKRKAGYVAEWGENAPLRVNFAMIGAAPNLGATPGDLPALIAAIEGARLTPGLIIIDTAAKTMNGADENGLGMAALLVNAEALASRFECFVLIVHHTGWAGDAQARPRGWSGLPFGLDLIIFCERKLRELSATITVQKLKDDEAGLQFVAHMKRVVLGKTKSGREVSTLIVERVEEAAPIDEAAAISAGKTKAWPRALMVFKRALDAALYEVGKMTVPRAGMPEVKAVDREAVREEFYRLYPADKPDAKRAAFNRREQDAIARGIMFSVNIGPDLAQTIFWT
jgi:hypothetical protein